jgi:hypothetical protein
LAESLVSPASRVSLAVISQQRLNKKSEKKSYLLLDLLEKKSYM